MAALGHPVTGFEYHFLLGAMPLFVLPVLYAAAARSAAIDAFRAPVLWARGFGGGVLVVLPLVYRPEGGWIYMAIGAADLVWAAVHAALWRDGAPAPRG